MNTRSFSAWLHQPTTIHGIAALVATAAGAVAWLASHSSAIAAGAAGTVFGVIAAALNDNSADPSAVEKLVSDAATALVQKRVAAMLPTLIGDVQAALAPPPPPPAPPSIPQGTAQ